MPQLSRERVSQAKALRAAGSPWAVVAATLGCSEFTLKTKLIPGWRERNNMRVNRNRAKRAGRFAPQAPLPTIKSDRYGEPRTVVPADVLADRDRRAALEHTSVTAARMGDPLPTRSALDQKRAAQNVIKLSRRSSISAIVEKSQCSDA